MIVRPKATWLRMVFMLRGSTLAKTWPRLLMVAAVAEGVTYTHEKYGWFHTNLTLVPFTLIGLALGIFLGFRNNTSYDRFWEGRKLWGRVVNTSRSLTRQMLTLVGPAEGVSADYRTTAKGDGAPEEVAAVHKALVYRVIAYVHSLRLHLRTQDRLKELAPFLSEDELKELEPEQNRPIALLQRIGAELRALYDKGWIHTMHLPVLEASLTEFANVQGGCERIKATPIPFSYNILLHRIVFVYCFTLPFGLVTLEGVGDYTPIIVLLVSYAFFGLDAVGDEIENPFGEDPNDLPLNAITRMIEGNLRQRLGETELPEPVKPKRFVLT
ncbi:MAG: bestrophin family ion channel [Myxococcota bacterium]